MLQTQIVVLALSCVVVSSCNYLACPKGWQLFSGHCYYFSQRKTTWIDAKNKCLIKGGHLAEPSTKKSDTFVSGHSIQKGVHYWIGLSDRVNEGAFAWEHNNEPIKKSDWVNWVPGDPNNANGNEDCVLTNWHKKWADAPCTWKVNYACQTKPSCAPGWHKKGCNCYWFSDSKKTWDAAKKACQRKGAFLAEPKDAETDHFIYSDAVKKGVTYWIGLNDIKNEGKFTWQSSSEPVGFSNWHPGDPNNHKGIEHCVLINWKNHSKWVDAKCTLEENFVCQGRLE